MKLKLNLNLQKYDLRALKDFYDKNRQNILTVLVIIGCIFFLFYWTGKIIDAKKREYTSSAETGYKRLVDASGYVTKIKQSEATGGRNTMRGASLLAFAQNTGDDTGIGDKIVNIRPMGMGGAVEHISMRMENLYYDEFINFISRVEAYDNLRIKTASFSRRYDNPSMIDVSVEIVLTK